MQSTISSWISAAFPQIAEQTNHNSEHKTVTAVRAGKTTCSGWQWREKLYRQHHFSLAIVWLVENSEVNCDWFIQLAQLWMIFFKYWYNIQLKNISKTKAGAVFVFNRQLNNGKNVSTWLPCVFIYLKLCSFALLRFVSYFFRVQFSPQSWLQVILISLQV